MTLDYFGGAFEGAIGTSHMAFSMTLESLFRFERDFTDLTWPYRLFCCCHRNFFRGFLCYAYWHARSLIWLWFVLMVAVFNIMIIIIIIAVFSNLIVASVVFRCWNRHIWSSRRQNSSSTGSSTRNTMPAPVTVAVVVWYIRLMTWILINSRRRNISYAPIALGRIWWRRWRWRRRRLSKVMRWSFCHNSSLVLFCACRWIGGGYRT